MTQEEFNNAYAEGYAQAIADAAWLCDQKYAIRAAQQLPREASTARNLAAEIRRLKKGLERDNDQPAS